MLQDQTRRAEAAMAMHRLLAGGWVAQIIHTAAELGLADHFGAEAKDVASLAGATATHPPSLSRLLRALAAVGVVHETDDRRYTLTPLGATLRTDQPLLGMTCVPPSILSSWCGDCVERVAIYRVAAGGEAGCGDTLACLRGDVRQLEDRAAHLRVAAEDRQKQRPIAAAQIDDPAETAKRVMRDDLGVDPLCDALLRRIVQRRGVGMRG